MNIFIQKIDLAGENPVLSADAVPQEDGTVEALWTVDVTRNGMDADLTGWEVCAYVKAADGEEIEPISGRPKGRRITVPLSGLPAVPMTLALKLEKDGQKQTLAVLKMATRPSGARLSRPLAGIEGTRPSTCIGLTAQPGKGESDG